MKVAHTLHDTLYGVLGTLSATQRSAVCVPTARSITAFTACSFQLAFPIVPDMQ